MKKGLKLIITAILISGAHVVYGATMEKDFTYTKYTLGDTYKYEKAERSFQWHKISEVLDKVDSLEGEKYQFGTLKNYKNENGLPAASRQMKIEKYADVATIERDAYGNKRSQGIPLYVENKMDMPERYALDGTLITILAKNENVYKARVKGIDDEWIIPVKYVRELEVKTFKKVIVVDRKNQNVITTEKNGDKWMIRSMNPVSTGMNNPPHQSPTPLGFFVVQGKKTKMNYLKDGSQTEIDGYAPHATRFSGGGYVHGIPVNLPQTEEIEYTATLGTIPRSHMCVRNATSHAKYVYDWTEANKDLVVVIE